jgi:predicted nucleic acid-binding protein
VLGILGGGGFSAVTSSAALALPTDKFVEVASSAEADVIVTGDMDLLVLNPFRGIRILTPAKYIRP